MDRERILEFLRLVITAFIIAFIINLFRILVFENGNFALLLHNNETEQMMMHERRIQQHQGQNTSTNTNATNTPVVNPTSTETLKINMRSPICLNGMTREQVLDLRRQAVKNSPLFSNMKYEPNPQVFSIGDGLPWISLEGALHFKKIPVEKRVEGVSRESVGILNPELLYYLSTSENEDAETNDFKTLYKDFYFVPYKLTYTPQTKTITAYIKNKTNKGDYQPIFLSDSNAHDLGYNYAYMDKSSDVGTYSGDQYQNNSLKKDIKEITGYYTIGSVCGLSGGCNNYAPYWQYYNHIYLKRIPASFNIKLWKKRPNSVEQDADINFTMVFESLDN